MVRAVRKRSNVLGVSNAAIADALAETADLLERQGANPYRTRAYRHGAASVRHARQPVAKLLIEGGPRALLRLPGIGDSLAEAIGHIVRAGRLPLLEKLRNDKAPEAIFTTVADIGPKLATRIRDELGIGTLTELEAAAWDGRLARVPGMGVKRVRAVRESLGGRFHRRPAGFRPGLSLPLEDQPSVELLLSIDREYRELAVRDRLLRVAPRQFNPTGEAWLPILRVERHGRQYTAMFSNSRGAHEAGALRDWVVVTCDDKKHGGVWTVVTAAYGPHRGRRVVRGREAECESLHGKTQTTLPFLP
jgi:hypothetical protein